MWTELQEYHNITLLRYKSFMSGIVTTYCRFILRENILYKVFYRYFSNSIIHGHVVSFEVPKSIAF